MCLTDPWQARIGCHLNFHTYTQFICVWFFNDGVTILNFIATVEILLFAQVMYCINVSGFAMLMLNLFHNKLEDGLVLFFPFVFASKICVSDFQNANKICEKWTWKSYVQFTYFYANPNYMLNFQNKIKFEYKYN